MIRPALLALPLLAIAGLAMADDPKQPPVMKPAAPAAGAAAAPRMAPPMPPQAPETCFELSTSNKTWPREPEQLCLQGTGDPQHYTLRLQSVLPGGPKNIGTFNLLLKTRARCLDCNADVFTLETSAVNSPLASMTITFSGKRDPAKGESGTINLFGKKLFYRNQLPAAPAAPATK